MGEVGLTMKLNRYHNIRISLLLIFFFLGANILTVVPMQGGSIPDTTTSTSEKEQFSRPEGFSASPETTRTEPYGYQPAPLRNPLMNGLFFPQAYYSELRFEVEFFRCYWWSSYAWGYLKLDIEAVQDTYDRYLYVYLDGIQVGSRIRIKDEIGFHETVSYTSTEGKHHLTLRIYSGNYKPYGWKLTNLEVINYYYYSSGLLSTYLPFPGNVLSVYFPKASRAQLTFDINAGKKTKMNLFIKNEDDTVSRFFSAYVNGITKISEGSTPNLPWSSVQNLNLGTYNQNSSHKLTLQVRWGSYKEWGWKILLQPRSDGLLVHYRAVAYEVDYMTGHKPHVGVLNYIESYYCLRGFERIEFFIDDLVTHDSQVTVTEYYNNYYNKKFDHRGESLWKYILFGHKTASSALGWAYPNSDKIFIADAACDDYANWHFWVSHVQVEKVVLMHECGHSIGIIDYYSNNNENYCKTAACVMAKVSAWFGNCNNAPWYCYHHWKQRNFP
ncbi:MAG: hypothetical protein ACFFCQ_15500 [Promethearchaeota archaeon]